MDSKQSCSGEDIEAIAAVPTNIAPIKRRRQKPRDGSVLICQICEDTALGYNFNAITCESCKAFFRRNALKTEIPVCCWKGQCRINQHSRKLCSACRLNKCFDVGMQKEWILDKKELEKRRRKGGVGSTSSETLQITKASLPLRKTTHCVSQQTPVPQQKTSQSVSKQTPLPQRIATVFVSQQTSLSQQKATVCVSQQTSKPQQIANACVSQLTSLPQQIATVCVSQQTPLPQQIATVRVSQQTSLPQQIKTHRMSQQTLLPQQIKQNCVSQQTLLPQIKQNSFSGETPLPQQITTRCVSQQTPFLDTPTPTETNGGHITVNTVSIQAKERIKSDLCNVPNERGVKKKPVTEDTLQPLTPEVKSELCNLAEMHRTVFYGGYTEDQTKTIVVEKPCSANDLFKMSELLIYQLIKFVKHLPEFKALEQIDQIALLKGGMLDVLAFHSAMNFDPVNHKWKVKRGENKIGTFVDATIIIKQLGVASYEDHLRFAESFQQLTKSDSIIITLMFVIVVLSADRPHLRNKEAVKQARAKFSRWLQMYLQSILPEVEAQGLYQKLRQKVLHIRGVGEQLALLKCELDAAQLQPLIVEVFNLRI